MYGKNKKKSILATFQRKLKRTNFLKNKLKIIATVTNDLTYDQRMIRICTSLVNAGYEVVLVGRKLSNSQSLSPRAFQQKRLRCFFNKGKFFYVEYNIRLFFYLLFTRFDIVNSIDLDTILPGFYISKIKNKTLVYDAHEYFTEVPEVVSRPRIQAFWKAVEKQIVPHLKYCYTVGGSLAELFEKEYNVPFGIVRNVPFLSKENNKNIKDDNKREPKILLYQGALNEGRGIEQLIKAMQSVENAVLWLAGEGDLSQELRQLSRGLEVEDKVRFLGFLKPEELQKVTLQVDIGLNLLQNKGLSYYYSLANKAFDYIQARKPSINMSFPEYTRINEEYETFCLIDDLEIRTITAAVNRLIEEPEYYQKLVNNCEDAAKIFIWEKEEKELLKIYNKIKNLKK